MYRTLWNLQVFDSDAYTYVILPQAQSGESASGGECSVPYTEAV